MLGRPPAIPALGGASREAWGWLVAHHGMPGRGDVVGLPPGVQARVEFMERSAGGMLREAVARELRPALPA